MTKVSVVTISYNQEKYIKQALDSFIEQRADFDFEVIVADDASTDRTSEIIRKYAVKHPDIIKPILRKKNIGAIANSIDALKAAKGEYIALCEGDDYWTDPEKLARQVDFMDKNKEYALCFHPVKVFFEDNSREPFTYPEGSSSKFTTTALIKSNFIQTNSVMYRRQTYDTIPKNILPLDWYLHLYHAQFGKIGFINRVMSAYRRHDAGMWWNSDNDSAALWEKHGAQHLNLYVEILKLYGSKAECKGSVAVLINNIFSAFTRIDPKKGKNLLKKVLAQFPEQAEAFIISQRQEYSKSLEAQRAHMEEQAKIIEHLTNELNDRQRRLDHSMQVLEENRVELDKIKRSVAWRAVSAPKKIRRKLSK